MSAEINFSLVKLTYITATSGSYNCPNLLELTSNLVVVDFILVFVSIIGLVGRLVSI